MNTRKLVVPSLLLLLVACSDSSDDTNMATAPITPCPAATTNAIPGTTPGVYLAPNGSDETGDGSMDKPYATFARAMKHASATLPIFACAGAYAEKIDLAPSVSIHGGLLCDAHWKTSTQRSTVLGFRALDAGNVTISDLDVIAPDATEPGASSIAAYVQNAQVSFARVQLRAGAGAAGKPGDAGSAAKTPGAELLAGSKGNPTGQGGMNGNLGPAGTANSMCSTSVGGAGGTGFEAKGGNGGNGLVTIDPTLGVGGGGDIGAGCGTGQLGQFGAVGASGNGGHGKGTIGLGGFVGVAGANGLSGAAGQGGGGGGAAHGKLNAYGASGGSGGAGGCGGFGGNGGAAGGSSFALFVQNGGVHFESVIIVASKGGAGGAGGVGGLGGDGGIGGAPGDKGVLAGVGSACAGGDGGVGGNGGWGGSGTGGHSAGIVFVGDAPVTEGATITIGDAGKSTTLAGAPDAAKGDDGLASSTLALDELN